MRAPLRLQARRPTLAPQRSIAGQVKFPFGITMNTEQLAVDHHRGRVHRAAVGAVPLHPVRSGHPGRGREREGRDAARLLARVPGRHELGVARPCISALLGILVAGNQSRSTRSRITLLVIPALSVALVGNLTSFGITTAAAFGLGDDAGADRLLPATAPGIRRLPAPPVARRRRSAAVRRDRGGAVLPRQRAAIPRRDHRGRLPFAPNPSRIGTRDRRADRRRGVRGRVDVPRHAERPARDHDVAHRRGDQPVVRRDHRLRRPDLAGPDDARRHQRASPCRSSASTASTSTRTR